VVANLFLGREELNAFRILEEEEMEKKAIDVLQGLSVKLPSVRTAIASLSGGQRQSVAVARVVAAVGTWRLARDRHAICDWFAKARCYVIAAEAVFLGAMLVAAFGQSYGEYRRQVGALLPSFRSPRLVSSSRRDA